MDSLIQTTNIFSIPENRLYEDSPKMEIFFWNFAETRSSYLNEKIYFTPSFTMSFTPSHYIKLAMLYFATPGRESYELTGYRSDLWKQPSSLDDTSKMIFSRESSAISGYFYYYYTKSGNTISLDLQYNGSVMDGYESQAPAYAYHYSRGIVIVS